MFLLLWTFLSPRMFVNVAPCRVICLWRYLCPLPKDHLQCLCVSLCVCLSVCVYSSFGLAFSICLCVLWSQWSLSRLSRAFGAIIRSTSDMTAKRQIGQVGTGRGRGRVVAASSSSSLGFVCSFSFNFSSNFSFSSSSNSGSVSKLMLMQMAGNA